MFTEEYIINVYCLVDEMLKKVVKNNIRQRGSAPKLYDAEVITMKIAVESFAIDQNHPVIAGPFLAQRHPAVAGLTRELARHKVFFTIHH